MSSPYQINPNVQIGKKTTSEFFVVIVFEARSVKNFRYTGKYVSKYPNIKFHSPKKSYHVIDLK